MFTSLHFIFLFLPVIVINYLLPQRYRWIFLLIASYYFYIDWQPLYAILLFITTSLTYLAGILLSLKRFRKTQRKFICIIGSLLPLGSLFFFKYYNFLTSNIRSFLETIGIYIELPEMKMLLPLGISFYTFSAIGYLIDIYRNKYRPEKNFGIFCLFISFFAQILSGPIPRGDGLIPQLRHPSNLSYENIMSGFRMMLWGYFMKLCVADNLSIYVDSIFNNLSSNNGGSFMLASLLYTIQIYCDFAGYSFIAIGAAKMLGITLMENFRRPYLAKNIKDFWSRWHISLSSWFRDYVYIPLGGNRVSKKRHKFNLMLTFLVSGIWHGAAWNFIIWGGLHGGGQIVEKSFDNRFKIPQFLKIMITFMFVSIGWVFFRLESVNKVFQGFKKVIFDFGIPSIDAVLLYGLLTLIFVVIKDYIDEYHPNVKLLNSDNFWVSNISTGIFLAIIVLFGTFGSGNFIYFQF